MKPLHVFVPELFKRSLAAFLSICIVGSTMVSLHAEAQVPMNVDSAGSSSGAGISNVSPGFGASAGLGSGVKLNADGPGHVFVRAGKPAGDLIIYVVVASGTGAGIDSPAGVGVGWSPGPGPGVRTVFVQSADPSIPIAFAERPMAGASSGIIASSEFSNAKTKSRSKKSKLLAQKKNPTSIAQQVQDTSENISIAIPNATLSSEPPAKAGLRLSEWLIQEQRRKQEEDGSLQGAEQPKVAKGPEVSEKPEPYPLGIAWIVPSEVAPQEKQKDRLLETLKKLQAPSGEKSFDTSRKALQQLIASMPVTGRALLPNTDPRYLEVNPKQDPILQEGEEIRIPLLPQSITVIRSDGVLCKVKYQPNVETRQYYRACRAQSVVADWAWVIEPDGKIRVVPTADWNEAKQDLPAPGAWIWAPPRGSGWSNKDAREFSEQLAAFLSTQEISGDALSPDNEVNLRRPPILSVDDRYKTSRDLPLSSGIWGEIGLLETPTARIAPAGTVSVGLSSTNPYQQLNFFLTPIDFMEFGFRYTNINNVPYASGSSQTYKDKSFDVKFRLWEESAYLPQIAVGGMDILGTGIFSGEYVVANKRWSDLDFSLGMGWGYLGSRSNIPNPFSKISSAYKTRPPPVVGEGGTLSGNYFYGPSALIGGVQYHTPWDNLILKAELDGNNYQNEPFGAKLTTKTPLNFGAVYRMGSFDWTLGVRGAENIMLALTWHDRLDQMSVPKLAEAKAVPVQLKNLNVGPSERIPNANYSSVATSFNSKANYVSEVNAVNGSSGVAANATAISSNASAAKKASQPVAVQVQVPTITPTQTLLDLQTQTGWQVDEIRVSGNTWIVKFNNAAGAYLRERLDRGVAVLHRDAPSDIQDFQLQLYNLGIIASEHKVDRMQWMLSQTQLLPPSQKKPTMETIIDPVLSANTVGSSTWGKLDHKPYDGSLGVGYQQIVGGTDLPLLFAISAVGDGTYNFDKNTWLSGTLNVRAIDNFGKYQSTTQSSLPPVRTDIRQYMTTSVATMPNLQATRTFQYEGNHFGSLYGGYLEMMFAGAGGEYLYRPSNSRFAVGVDANRVYQRQFNVWTSLQKYSVNTGHLTGYWDTGLEDILVKASVGQYLAGDRGGTLDLSRVFSNGVKIGAYVTKTNVSAAQYGEGSFDKGVYIAVPFDAFFAMHSDSVANLLWTPLIRDGGQKLYRKYPLYDITNSRDGRALATGSAILGD